MEILLYGLGNGLLECQKTIKKEHNIIGYTDSFSKLNNYMGKLFFCYDNISSVKFDYLIITVRKMEIAQSIKEKLLLDYSIEEYKIKHYFSVLNYEIWKNKMATYCLENTEIMIFGNSHAAYGFLEDYFSVPTLNLAVPSQDIFHSYVTFHECIKNYGDRLKKLKLIIIDLYDYIVFNIDITRLNVFANYINCGGYMSEYKTGEDDRIFENIYKGTDLHEVQRWKHIDKYPDLRSPELFGSVINQSFESTIQNNVLNLENFVKEIYSFNSTIKICFTLIPRYIYMEIIEECYQKQWKRVFEDNIMSICDKYQIIYLNYKNREEISKNNFFYFDTLHLNTTGAIAMTSILDSDLKDYKLI